MVFIEIYVFQQEIACVLINRSFVLRNLHVFQEIVVFHMEFAGFRRNRTIVALARVIEAKRIGRFC